MQITKILIFVISMGATAFSFAVSADIQSNQNLNWQPVNSSMQISEVLEKQLNDFSNLARYQHANWSLIVKDPKSDKILYQKNSNLLLAPASVNKLLSATAALHYLGKNYKFVTPLYVDGAVNNGVINGNLIMVGSGDFIFGGRSIDTGNFEYPGPDHSLSNELPGAPLVKGDPLFGIHYLAKKLYQAGVREINGNVLVDDRLFETINQRGVLRAIASKFKKKLLTQDHEFDLLLSFGDSNEGNQHP